MVTLRASQGQRKWGNRSEQQMKTATSVSVSVSVRLRVCVDAAVAAAVSRGWHFSFKSLRIEKRRDAPGRETSHFQLERRWEEPVTEAGEGIYRTVTPARPQAGDQNRRNVLELDDWFSFLKLLLLFGATARIYHVSAGNRSRVTPPRTTLMGSGQMNWMVLIWKVKGTPL